MPNIDEAIEALLSYQQADMEGVMVLTSRQAIHEVADELKRVRSHAQGARDQIEIRDGITDGYCDIINQTKKTTIGRVHLWNGTAQDLRDILVPASLTPAACEQPDIDALAQFIRDAEREHGQCDDDDTYISYRPTARAILQKFDVRPKHSSTMREGK